jgi:16S rRNA (guanine966-N2)-methyltransferase
VRITGGEWASRRLAGPRGGVEIRPTPDALREQGFAILSPVLAGAAFLDLFAGTGAVTLEALSRGAARAVTVERDRRAVELIRRNLEALGVGADRCELVPGTARNAIGRLAQRGLTFGAGWCDPPFALWDDGLADLALAAQQRLFAAGAPVVLETPPRRDVAVPGFEVVRALRGAVLLRALAAPAQAPAPL